MDYEEGTLSAALWTKVVLPDMGATSLSHPGTRRFERRGRPCVGSARVRNHAKSLSYEMKSN